MGHSMSDPLHGVYRTKEEVEEQRKRDPISQLAGKLKEEGVLDEAGLDALDAEARRRSRKRCASPIRAPIPIPPSSPPRAGRLMATLTYRDALNQALREEMQRDPRCFSWVRRSGVPGRLQGESWPAGGVRADADRGHADRRARFAGIGVGAAMAGLRPVIEFMTWNFACARARSDRQLARRSCTSRAARSPSRSCFAAERRGRCSSRRSTLRPGTPGWHTFRA